MRDLLNIGQCEDTLTKQVETVSLLESYKRQKLQAEIKVLDLEDAIKFLEENPKFEDFAKLLGKLRY